MAGSSIHFGCRGSILSSISNIVGTCNRSSIVTLTIAWSSSFGALDPLIWTRYCARVRLRSGSTAGMATVRGRPFWSVVSRQSTVVRFLACLLDARFQTGHHGLHHSSDFLALQQEQREIGIIDVAPSVRRDHACFDLTQRTVCDRQVVQELLGTTASLPFSDVGRHG